MSDPAAGSADRRLAAHQQSIVDDLLGRPEGRVVVEMPLGWGLTTALATFCARWVDQHPGGRVLIVIAHPVLSEAWSELLASNGVSVSYVDAQSYRRAEAQATTPDEIWSDTRRALVVLDTVKRPSRLVPLVDAGWELVIVDEASALGAGSERARALEALTEPAPGRLAVMTHPLPDQPRPHSVADTVPNWREGTRSLWTRGPDLVYPSGEYAVLFDGASPQGALEASRVWPLLRQPLRPATVLRISWTKPEARLYQAVAGIGTRPTSLSSLQVAMLRRRAASSMFALDETLRSMQSSVGSDSSDQPAGETGTDQATWSPFGAWLTSMLDFEPDLDFHAVDAAEVDELIGLLESVRVDSKADLAADFLNDAAVAGSHPLVFTEFADTARYVADVAASGNHEVVTLTGGDSHDGRAEKVDVARRRAASVIVATTASAVGLDMSFATAVLHYDLPSSPIAMQSRMGRVDRIGTGGVPPTYALVDGVLVDRSDLRQLGLATDVGSDPGHDA